MMAAFRERWRSYFPLRDTRAVIDLFEDQLRGGCADDTTGNEQPDLTLLSLVLGTVENALTVNRFLPPALVDTKTNAVVGASDNTVNAFPTIDLEPIEALYYKFVSHVKGAVDLSRYPSPSGSGGTNTEFVKHVSDVIWGNLSRTYYKDNKAHLQTLYSFLTGNKLDSFGVAFAVVAACQVLGHDDVHLALSEDHAWIVYGNKLEQTLEVTWHGKGLEDKRGQTINDSVSEKSWLYLNGNPVICTRAMEVAAIVSGINPSITANHDSIEMASLQHELLWLLYDKGYLKLYPMALGNLGDLQEIRPGVRKVSAISLFQEAVGVAIKQYNNHHVYPHTYMGGYMYKKSRYKEAFRSWAAAASVIQNYNYNREDEEIYKEFLEIANTHVPNIVKLMSGGERQTLYAAKVPFLLDPECYAFLLKFYDGICLWEEGSSTPVLHIGWAQHFVFSLSKFEASVRQNVKIEAEGVEEDEDDSDEDSEIEEEIPVNKKKNLNATSLSDKKENVNGDLIEDQIKSTIMELESKVASESQSGVMNPNIAALAQACGESILNPEYLISGGEPFTSTATTPPLKTTTLTPINPLISIHDSRVDLNDFLSSKSNGSQFPGLTMDSMLKADSPAGMMLLRAPGNTNNNTIIAEESATKLDDNKPTVLLRSQKMKGLRKLLSNKKFNASAIKLQLTAQSQVSIKHTKRNGEPFTGEFTGLRKRIRRE
ncbi:menin-like [Tubulanus polymorphus]|uniref:menin-like n=1 Tax=Tubulanus polymorphus TaxID=672921 RepID=UPI003DA23502